MSSTPQFLQRTRLLFSQKILNTQRNTPVRIASVSRLHTFGLYCLFTTTPRSACTYSWPNGTRVYSIAPVHSSLSASVRVNGGRAELCVPVNGTFCNFLLLPTDDVKDIVTVVENEIGGNVTVELRAGGVRIARNTTVPTLLKGGDFDLVCGNDVYTIANPGLELINEYRRLSLSVKHLSDLMNAEAVHKELVERAEIRLANIDLQLAPIHEKVLKARSSAGKWTDTYLWGGLVVMATQFGILARMTWWEYSWDVVEPITYFVTYGGVIATYAVYCITRTSTEYTTLFDRKYLQFLHKNIEKVGVNQKQYNELLVKRAEAQSTLTLLKHRDL
eukprot:CFRG6183T1